MKSRKERFIEIVASKKGKPILLIFLEDGKYRDSDNKEYAECEVDEQYKKFKVVIIQIVKPDNEIE